MVNEIGVDRSAQQKVRHHKALLQRFRASMSDRAKLSILSYMEQNPQWTPEELKIITNYFIRKYGLHNRYVPAVPKAAVDAVELHENAGGKVETNADAPGTQSPSGD